MNTKTSKNSFFFRTAAIFMIAMLLLAAMPVKPAFAATSVLVPWAKAYDQATGTGAGATRTIPAGSGRVLVVGIATASAVAGTVGNPTVTYGGVTLTLATENGSTTGRMHTWLYYLKDNAVMDNTARPLNVTMGAGAILNMTVWSAVYAGVNQAPATYTTGNGFSNVTASGPAQLSAAMAVNAGDQAVYISSVYNAVNTTVPTYTINANWTTGGNNTGTDAGTPAAWKDEVANRTVPGANVTDTAATSALAPAFNERYAMSAMSLPAAVAPTVTTQAVTAIGTTTATGNGNITNLGVPNPTQYGVVWDTAINPTVALATKTAQGPIAVTGAFTSSITGLTSNTLYHVRAYATNSAGTSYGADVTFTTLPVAPTITSAAPANSTTGAAYSHTYTATGSTPMTFSVTAGSLPTGLTLTPAGVLSGTPTVVGTYTGTVTAANGTLPNATQNFTITINAASAITSANNTSFTLGLPGTFTVTATGSPTPTLSMTGTLPAGVTFIPATGILAGTPAAGTGGTYALTFTAANGVGANAVQNFTLTITDGPSFTSANTTAFSLGFPGTFTVTAVGTPAPTLSMTGSLPAGVTFTPATGVLAGTPTVVGSYTLTFTATNGILPNATQTFTLTVKSGPNVAPNGINSVPDTGNGSISNNESILDTLNITQLIVKFDQDVYDPAGNTDPKDVTNPANYMLVMIGSGNFQTVSCLGGVQAPDVAIPINSVSYNSSTFTATVFPSNPLNVDGAYRLYVCGTTSIVDAANINLELAGDGANPGTDFLLNFRIQGPVRGNNNNNASSTSAKATLIPLTGFAPDKVTVLPAQPADKAYKSLGEIRIEIPSLGINYPIVGAMLDKNTWDLTWLKDSVAYLEGSAYPTLPGNTVLTAHVVDANNNLGPFSDIKGLQTGQKIYIHANGQTYVYQVQENQKIFATNISAAFKHEENSWITLVTCEDYNAKTGAYQYRRMVRAVLISVISEK